MTRQPKTAKRKKWGSFKKRLTIPKTTQARVVAEYLTGAKQRAISRKLGLDRETVPRILSQPEVELLVQSYRDVVLKIVPDALIGAYELVQRLNPKTITDVLKGARVLIDRHQVEHVQRAPVQDYSYSRIRFFGKYKRWPTDEEAAKFQKTIPIKPTVKGELTE